MTEPDTHLPWLGIIVWGSIAAFGALVAVGSVAAMMATVIWSVH